ncbi:MAG: DeoR/GlpR transcriptional regulator [Clostridia bacterium]|nr:DeoR/GlpR transcriptional regulator [Clostridia bacterium]
MKTRRLEEMEHLINEQGSATMEELRDAFGVSINTVRRDVAELVEAGRAEKVYGGVRAIGRAGLVPYEERFAVTSAAKEAICAKAASLVRSGDIVYIDSGTTTVHLMDALRDKTITVITNNIEIILRALEAPNIRLIVLPGELNRNTRSITGDASADFLSRFNTNIAFMAATGVSHSGVSNSSPLEYAIKKTAVAHTDQAVLMVTGNKFGVTSLMTYADLNAFRQIITDPGIPEEWLVQLEESGLEMVVV